MSAICPIAPDKLVSLVGAPTRPVLIDVRIDEFKADPRLIPGSIRRSHTTAAKWASTFSGRTVVAICKKGATQRGRRGLASSRRC